MAQLGNYHVGHTPAGPTGGALKSTPKLTKFNGDDSKSVIWRNLGNNHAYPFVWAQSATVASGIFTVTLASGVKFHGFDLATYANVSVTPCWDAGDVYVTKNTTLNTITCTVETAGANDGTSTLDVKYMLGESIEISGMNCDGMWSDMPPTGYNS